MPNIMKNITRYPLSQVARRILVIALIVNILTLVVVSYYSAALANMKIGLLLIPAIFFIVVTAIALVLRYRYALLERYPYLVTLPSFVWRLGAEKNKKMLGEMVGKVFTVHALGILYISLLGLVETYWAFVLSGQTSVSVLLSMVLIIVAAFLISIFALYRGIYRSFAYKKR